MACEKQVAIFYAVLNGHFDRFEIEQAKKMEGLFLEYIAKLHDEDILKPIRETGNLIEETEAKLKAAIEKFLIANS